MGHLAAAAREGLRPLTDRGYRLVGVADSQRGEAVEAVRDLVVVRIATDWLEGEIDVSLQAAGFPAVPLSNLVDVSRAHGLHLTRLPRSAGQGKLESVLGKVADLLVDQAAEVLDQTPEGLARLTG